jgi:polysaccharide biosynthesis transport protein
MAPDEPTQSRGYWDAHKDRDSDSFSEKNLRNYLDVLVRRIWVVFAVLIIAALISVIFAVTRTPVYTSVATIEFDEKKPKSDDRLASGSGAEYDLFRNYLSTQMEILKSRAMAEALVGKMNLLESPEFSPKARGWLDALLMIPSALTSLIYGNAPAIDAAASSENRLSVVSKTVVEGTTVKPVKTSNLVTVSISATHPGLSREMLGNYLNLYLERNLEQRRRESAEASRWLKDELQNAEQKLKESKANLVEFIIDNRLVLGKGNGVVQILDMVDKVWEERIKSQETRLKMEALQHQKGTDQGAILPANLNIEYVGKLKEQLAGYEAEYMQLKGVYAPAYPKMTNLTQKIEFLRQRISDIEKGLINTVVESAKTEEGLFQQTFEKARLESERFKTLETQLGTLKKVEETNEEFHRIILKEFKEQEIKSRTIANNARIVDAPSLPDRPSWPKKRLIVLVGCALGLFLGIAGAFTMEQLDSRVHSPQEIEQDFHVRKLAIVPDMKKIGELRAITGAAIKPEFVARQRPGSPVSDAIRNLQASVFLGHPNHPVQTMVVTSATPGEGKTLISVSTATVLGSKRCKTVLIDADLRRPRVHKVFGLNSSAPGLAEFLASPKVSVSAVIRESSMTGLSYIPSGKPSENPVELLQGDRMNDLVRELSELYDYIIIDTSPVLGIPDTQIISRLADGVLLVAKQGHVCRDELREAIRLVSSLNGCTFLGVVFNKAYAPGGYRYSYKYGPGYYRRYYGYYGRRA